MNLDGAVVLAVDDNPTNLDVVAKFLGNEGCRVLVARDAERAFERAHRTAPELVLVDVRMPDVDGFDFCRRLKSDPELRDVPVLFMTALTDDHSKQRAFEVGAVDYITKPIARAELLGRVSAHIQNARYRTQLEDEVERRTGELRHELREKELLIREVHHRVKNNLSVVVGLLQLQLADVERGADAADALRSSAERIYAMAHVHQMIYETGRFSDLDLAVYVESLIAELRASYDPAQNILISTDVASIIVDVGIAIPCGIIVNELVTNALKHGYPQRTAGEVAVRLVPDENSGFSLQVSDDGVGYQPNRTSGGLGLTLVETLVAQLGATISKETANGTSILIDVPCPETG